MNKKRSTTIPQRLGGTAEVNYGRPPAADFGPLARDRVPVRAMADGDLHALIAIDRKITGRDRSHYLEQKFAEATRDTDVRVSLIVEREGTPVGFIMGRVDFGEFGRMEPIAVLDTIGVDPDYQDQGIGRALLSQLLVNLATLRIECVRTEIDWHDRALAAFLDSCGFAPSQQLCFERSLS
jgi:ribosomal protein S18 acetylase RimI-like enzyme